MLHLLTIVYPLFIKISNKIFPYYFPSQKKKKKHIHKGAYPQISLAGNTTLVSMHKELQYNFTLKLPLLSLSVLSLSIEALTL